ncbi:TIR domain-containing protein [Erythrobacter sp. Alg231-14]|uniref:TIR domain-containing protein n=1 Tax=Erythrobacter sp. Alg231-14 TaxID=1922225 RepID=UPI000D54E536
MAIGEEDSPSCVFISHHSSKADEARQLKAALHDAGISGWMAPDDIGPGMAFDEAIVDQIKRSDAVILMLCERADQSRHVKRELMIGEDNKCPVFPLRLEDIIAKGLTYWLQDYQWLDWIDRSNENTNRLANDIRQQIDRKSGQGEDSLYPRSINRVAKSDDPVRNPTEKRERHAVGWSSTWVKAAGFLALVGAGLTIWFQVQPGEDVTPLEPGSWELGVRYDSIEAPSAPAILRPGILAALNNYNMNHTVCFSSELSAEPSLVMLRTLNRGELGYDCRVTESIFQDGAIKMRALCESPEFEIEEPIQVSMEGTFSRTTVDAEISTRSQSATLGTLEAFGTVRFRRVGHCR